MRQHPRFPYLEKVEDLLDLHTATGTAYMAGTSLFGMLAKTYYSFGLLEVMQNITTNHEDQEFQAEQVIRTTNYGSGNWNVPSLEPRP